MVRGLLAASSSYFALFGLMLTVPFLVERGFGGGPAEAGLVLLALPLMIGLSAPVRRAACPGARGASGSARLGAPRRARHAGGGVRVGLTRLADRGPQPRRGGPRRLQHREQRRCHGRRPADADGRGLRHAQHHRGLGTALGLAAGGAIFAALGGSSRLGGEVVGAFSATAVLLAVAVAAGGLLAASGRSEAR